MEAEKEKFRAYIESSGLMSALTNTLVSLYEEPNKPQDAFAYFMDCLSSKSSSAKKIEMLEEKCKALEAEVKQLKEQLSIEQEPEKEELKEKEAV